MQTRTTLRLKKVALVLTMFACVAVPLAICVSLLLDLKEAIEANPIVKVQVAAAVFTIFLIYIKHKTGYELKSSIVNVTL